MQPTKFGVLNVVIYCPVCPAYTVALEPTDAQPARGLAIHAICQCGAEISAVTEFKHVKIQKPEKPRT